MAEYSREEIEQLIGEDVEFIRLQFTDLFGSMKNVAITSENLRSALDEKVQIHASSVEGFLHEDEEDVYLKPDLSTFKILPWRPQSGKVARMICDIRQSDGTPFCKSSGIFSEEFWKNMSGRVTGSILIRSVSSFSFIPMRTGCRRR